VNNAKVTNEVSPLISCKENRGYFLPLVENYRIIERETDTNGKINWNLNLGEKLPIYLP